MEKRKIFFWTIYAILFALFFVLLRFGYYTIVPHQKLGDVIFVLLLFIIVSPLSTILSTILTNKFLGKEEK